MIKSLVFTLSLLLVFHSASAAQKGDRTLSPTETATRFYSSLRDKRYVEGFRLSVYRGAVEGLTVEELSDLESDFAATFAGIPEKIEAKGEKITGEQALVTLKFQGIDEPQQVELIRVDGEWMVGDREAFELVKAQGRSFFFNTRILVNENEAFDLLSRIIGAELIYARKFEGQFASLDDLIRLGGVPRDLESRTVAGYRYELALSLDSKSFSAFATPVVYGKTGRLSFYADATGVRAEDTKGGPASKDSPVFRPR